MNTFVRKFYIFREEVRYNIYSSCVLLLLMLEYKLELYALVCIVIRSILFNISEKCPNSFNGLIAGKILLFLLAFFDSFALMVV